MKFIILCFAITLVLADDVQYRWNAVRQKCQSDPDLYVDDTIFEKLKKGESPDLPANFGNHALCMMTNLNLLDKEGHILKEGVKEAVSRSTKDSGRLDEIGNECSSMEREAKEKTALALFECLGKHHINIGQL